jgi:hypothetical protein
MLSPNMLPRPPLPPLWVALFAIPNAFSLAGTPTVNPNAMVAAKFHRPNSLSYCEKFYYPPSTHPQFRVPPSGDTKQVAARHPISSAARGET